MAEATNIDRDWIGRLVRVLIVFRSFALLVTIIVLPERDHTALVALASLSAAVLSYYALRHWRRIAPTVSQHPAYLGVELLLATLILGSAGASSPFFYFTLGTAILAGVIYGRPGALPFSAVLISLYELVALEGFPHMHPLHDAQSIVFAPLLYPAAVVAGVCARELIERGAETEELLRERTVALAAERERLDVARELHDSLAKTVEGLAMTASVLPRRFERDPAAAVVLAQTLVGDARQAALEARALMSGLRSDGHGTFLDAVRERADVLAARAGVTVTVVCEELGDVPLQTRHELLRILGEAVINAARHGEARAVRVTIGCVDGELRMRIVDDGRGLVTPIATETLCAAGHYGLAGMRERAELLGGALEIYNAEPSGAVVAVSVPHTTAIAGALP